MGQASVGGAWSEGKGRSVAFWEIKSSWHPADQSLGPKKYIWIKVEKPETELAETRRKGQSFSQLDWVQSWLPAQQRIEVKTRNWG